MSKIVNTSSVSSKFILPDKTTKPSQAFSNQSLTENMSSSFLKTKTASKYIIEPNEKVDITLILNNSSIFDIFDVNILETIGSGAHFKLGSLLINGVENKNINPTLGFDLPFSIKKNTFVKVQYSIIAESQLGRTPIELNSYVKYSVNEVKNLVERLQPIMLTPNLAGISIEKLANKSVVSSGEVLTFKNIIKNNSYIPHTEVVFTDNLPSGSSFEESSVKINGEPQPDLNPVLGIMLKDLQPNEQIEIEFKVRVN